MKDKTVITVVLTLAITALIGFGIYSFTNYQQAKFEHEMGARAASAETPTEPVAEVGLPEVASPPAPVAPVPTLTPASPPVAQVPATEAEVFGQSTPDPRSPAAIAAAESRVRFEQMRQKEEALLRDLQQGRSGGSSSSPEFSAGATPSTTGNDSILGQGPAVPAAAPVAAPVLDRYQEEIQNEAAIARVTHFDEEWNTLVMSGGQDRNIAAGDKFAVRRGSSIVGYVKVQQVSVNESIASLVSTNRNNVTAVKPEIGDDLISYDRFALGAQR